MADSTALDLLKSLATDHGFRSQLQSLDARGKRDLLQRCGFGTLTASDMRTAAANAFGAQAEAAVSHLVPSAGVVNAVAASASAIETADGRALAPLPVAMSASAIETADGRALAPTLVAMSASAIETADGYALAPLPVAMSASAIETADGRALAPTHVAASASAIETVDAHVMASFNANFSHASASAYQKAA
ncbi:hypothetical protein SAMN02982917_5267 [Azospirillum oryzae]|uniref:Uncharacterized protein n=1 Tax=Azospirillum oryzae TaxID=286727 RepID=A0A1X7H953_9PROT|nr:hypothetical protein [Azospirillum oryzae]SMF81964.1 hypothetical protein SAMN02982917_5267 [Azospirillum oryzae]